MAKLPDALHRLRRRASLPPEPHHSIVACLTTSIAHDPVSDILFPQIRLFSSVIFGAILGDSGIYW